MSNHTVMKVISTITSIYYHYILPLLFYCFYRMSDMLFPLAFNGNRLAPLRTCCIRIVATSPWPCVTEPKRVEKRVENKFIITSYLDWFDICKILKSIYIYIDLIILKYNMYNCIFCKDIQTVLEPKRYDSLKTRKVSWSESPFFTVLRAALGGSTDSRNRMEHLSSVQKPCWLMIIGDLLPSILDYNIL